MNFSGYLAQDQCLSFLSLFICTDGRFEIINSFLTLAASVLSSVHGVFPFRKSWYVLVICLHYDVLQWRSFPLGIELDCSGYEKPAFGGQGTRRAGRHVSWGSSAHVHRSQLHIQFILLLSLLLLI